jgi:hydrogenase small subunit
MTHLTRRELLRVGAALAGAAGLGPALGRVLAAGLEDFATQRAKVVWVEGMSCSGCSVSLLNAENPGPLELLTEVISMIFHPTIGAAQGDVCMDVLAQAAQGRDYFLIVEGAVPTAMSQACSIGGRPLTELLPPMLRNARGIIAAGTCAAFGGIPAAEGNLTGAANVRTFMQQQGIAWQGKLVQGPGCPVHPDSLVGTLAYFAAKGYPQVDPELLTPDMFYRHSVHDDCPKFHYWEKREFAAKFGDDGCLFKLGCLGPLSHTNCPRRQWNGGTNWCIRAGAPCIACTNDKFAAYRDFPFYRKGERDLDLASVAHQAGGLDR